MRGTGVVHHPDDVEVHHRVVEPVQPVLVGGEDELVLASPAHEQVLHGFPGGLGHLVHGRSVRDEAQLDVHAHAGVCAQSVQCRSQTVGQVHAGCDRSGLGHRHPLRNLGDRDVEAVPGLRGIDAEVQRYERGGGPAEGSRDCDDISWVGAGARHRAPAVHGAYRGPGHDPRPGFGVPSDDPGAAVLAALVDPAHDVVRGLSLQVLGQCEGRQEPRGPGAHCGQVAEADGRCVPSELLVGHPRGEVPVEGHNVRGEHGAVGEHRGIVAGADRALRPDEASEVLDELPLADVAYSGHVVGLSTSHDLVLSRTRRCSICSGSSNLHR